MQYHNPKGIRWSWPCEKHDVCVVYVARYQDGQHNYQRFMKSLLTQRDKNFGLFIVYKGFPDIETMEEWHRDCTWIDYTSTMMADYGYDLTAYRIAADAIRNPILVFFNSSSELVHEDCIERLVAGLAYADICGCFGSWETFNGNWIARLLWKPFPNPHLRTNAFAISRKNFLLVWPRRFWNKLHCHLWESGKRGLSSRLSICIVNKHMVGKEPAFFSIGGFRYDNSKLLCLDKQSRHWTPEQAARTWTSR